MRPALAEFYGRQVAHPAHGEHWAGPPELVDRLASLAGTRLHHRLLDVGCGVGGPARRLVARVGCRVVGVDLLPRLVHTAHGTPGLGPCFTAGDATALPFATRTFDQLWCLGVLAHVADLAAFAEEAARVLRPGGVVVVTEAFWDGRREARFLATAPYPWRPLTLHELVNALRVNGCEAVGARDWPAAWPSSTGDEGLDADLRDGRLTPRAVVARTRD